MKFILIALLLTTLVLVSDETPTLKPFQPFYPAQDAEHIHDAIEGIRTDENTIIDILTHRTFDQRTKMAAEYARIYDKKFITEISNDLNDDIPLKSIAEALMRSFAEYLARMLDHATSLVNVDEDVYIDVLCPLNNTEKSQVIEKYTDLFGTLCDDVNYKLSESFQYAILHICGSQRNEEPTLNRNVIQPAAKELDTLNGDDFKNAFKDDLLKYTTLELRAIFQKYQDIRNEDIVHKIKKEFKGDTERAYVTTVKAIRNRAAYFAERVHECVKGTATKDDGLQIIVVSRCEIDLQDVKIEYQNIFHNSMRERVSQEVSGGYGDAILQLIGTD